MASRDLFVAACFLFVVAMVDLNIQYRSNRSKKDPAPELRAGHIHVTGWSTAEARRILGDFAKRYDLDAATFAVSDADGGVRVRWTYPITSDVALFLVNYLAYPADLDLSGKPHEAVGVIPVPAGIAPDDVAAGTLAKIYVPEDDTEHDLVHALLADGRAFRISFARMTWQPAGTPRASDRVQRLAFRTEG